MIDDVSDIGDYYGSDPDREHVRLARHQLEYDLTWRYLDRYLPAQGSILEVGAATGRYTLELARRGYAVTAVDLSPALLAQASKRIDGAGLTKQVRFVAADARDLQAVNQKDFDAVLLMGPLYHLVVEADRQAALKAVFERLRTGGVLCSAFISRLGLLGDLMKNDPGWIEDQAEVRAIIGQGQRHDARRGGFRGYFADVTEIAPLHEALGLETLALAGVEPAIGADDESYNRLEGQQRELWLDLLYKVSTEPSIMAASRHLLYIGRKKECVEKSEHL
ncbi:MAG: methyltransferase domain-containing protein [Chloroflexi bacterium]|nr:methyltransferase domain-containing protein [Chloroflexota bacterium]